MRPAADSGLARWLVARWYGQHPIVWLRPLAALYAVLTALRRALFRWAWWRTTRMAVPVVVVGNLVTGGAGKTPTVRAVVAGLQQCGWHPGIVSRGYGGRWSGPALVLPGSSAADCGDEALLLARALDVPVAVGRSRVAAAQCLLAAHPELDCVVCDDGLQHYALGRDIELVVVDRARGFGNGALLPAGPLREAPARLRRVSALIAHGVAPDAAATQRLAALLPAALPCWTLQLRMSAPRLLAGGATTPWTDWSGRTVHAAAGIAHPERFFAGLREQGLTVIAHAFPDHHVYRDGELDFPGSAPVLLTEKDAVKCTQPGSSRFWVVPLEARLPEDFMRWLINRLETARGRKTA